MLARLFIQPTLAYQQRPEEVTYFGCSFTEQISGDVGWNATLDAQAVRDRGLDLRPWRSCAFLRVGDWLAGGITGPRGWSNRQPAAGGRVTARGAGWMSYLRRRVLYDDKTYTATEQFDIVADLLAYVQSGPRSPDGRGDIGLQLVREPTNSGRTRDRAYADTELQWVGELVEELSEVIDGFEWTPTAAWPGTDAYPTRQLRLAYPSLGATANPPTVVDGAGCTVEGEDYSGDGVAGRVHAAGKADADDRPYVTAEGFVAGLPIVEKVTTFDTVTSVSRLTSHADAELERSTATQEVTVKMLDLAAYPLELFRPGDRFTLHSDQVGLHEDLNDLAPWRVISRTVVADDRGQATQTVRAMREVQAPGHIEVDPRRAIQFITRQRRRRLRELQRKNSSVNT